ncbi:hypothetical protein ACQP1G_30550 [Nocardia sp. CA-107356]|uniref:hypothetical protein n=1 Tax=Nocardia sp. CA-107356 TaxID=3239972 RepID=UPI003D8E86BD
MVFIARLRAVVGAVGITRGGSASPSCAAVPVSEAWVRELRQGLEERHATEAGAARATSPVLEAAALAMDAIDALVWLSDAPSGEAQGPVWDSVLQALARAYYLAEGASLQGNRYVGTYPWHRATGTTASDGTAADFAAGRSSADTALWQRALRHCRR